MSLMVNYLMVNERLLQIVVGVILACILLLIILIGLRNKIIARLRSHHNHDSELSSDSAEVESKTVKPFESARKNSLPSYEDCVKEKSNCPNYAK